MANPFLYKISLLSQLCYLLLGLLFSPETVAQRAELPPVLEVFPEKGSAYQARLAVFNPDYVWLGDRVFHLPTQRMIPKDSTFICQPTNAQSVFRGSDPRWPNILPWEADPYNDRYRWAREYWGDTLVLWRYDLSKTRQDCWKYPFRGTEVVFGKPGIWVSDHKELLLIDRETGKIIRRKAKPAEGILMYLKPWGDDVAIIERWVYRKDKNEYEYLFPLPDDLAGCRKPEKIEIYAEICASTAFDAQNKHRCFLQAPGQKVIPLPFSFGSCGVKFIFSADGPTAWICNSNKLVAIHAITGDSVVYDRPAGEPLQWQQSGRFLAFRSENGLSFFDKKNCESRVLPLPFGYEIPRGFVSEGQYIFLSFDNHWKILNVEKLERSFQTTSVQTEYLAFEKEVKTMQEKTAKDFYSQYAAYKQLLKAYEGHKNPKIEQKWDLAMEGIPQSLYESTDSVLEAIGKDYFAGHFDASVSCQIASALFDHWKDKNEVHKAFQLLQTVPEEFCVDENSGGYFIHCVKTIVRQLDSLEALKLAPDQYLYSTGRAWMDFCIKKGVDGFSLQPFASLEKPFSYFRQLILEYPQSNWADNAAYDSMHYMDYHPSCTDDFTPDGNDQEAFKTFEKFLKDYPDSEMRPDVLLRMAYIGARGAYNGNEGRALDCLNEIAEKYPDFARQSPGYQKTRAWVEQQLWSKTWSIEFQFERETYTLKDSIKLRVVLQNRTQSNQILGMDFLKNWHNGLKFSLQEVRDQGCESLSGDFPITAIPPKSEEDEIHVPPGGRFSRDFLLGRQSINRNYTTGTFELLPGKVYRCALEFRSEHLSWFWVTARKSVSIKIE